MSFNAEQAGAELVRALCRGGSILHNLDQWAEKWEAYADAHLKPQDDAANAASLAAQKADLQAKLAALGA